MHHAGESCAPHHPVRVKGLRARHDSRTIRSVTQPLTLDRATARRFLVHHHLLAPPRALPADPASVLTVMDRLGSLQFDPLDIAGRNHDLVLMARIRDYERAWTDGHLYGTRTLYETYNKGLSIVPDRGDAVVSHHVGPVPGG